MTYIQIGNTKWTASKIKALHHAIPEAVPTFGRTTLETASNWLKGKTDFTLYTSGSTGEPKPITFNTEQIKESAYQTINYFNLHPGGVLLNPLSVSYVAGFMMLMRSLILDTPLIQLKPTRQPVPDWLLATPPQMTSLVPLQFKAIAESSGTHRDFLNGINVILLGGGPLQPAIEKLARATGSQVYHTYGMTETLTHVAVRKVSPEPSNYFQALPGNTFSVDREDKLVIRSPLWDKPIHTNDRVSLLDPYHFCWLGRADRVINSGGYKVQIETVEKEVSRIIEHDNWPFSNFFITSLPDESLGEKVILILETPSHVQEGLQSALIAELKKSLDRYAVPKAIYALPVFPQTHTGKIDQRACLRELQLA